ncbi:hypothetical protein [Pseudonocardia sp.]|uniref:hypothetical protein n=1 Tax=Pseudonocardia sp. TaxID=60912 RepID=UPI003D0C99F0
MRTGTVRATLWLLPLHAALLALGTLTHQPDPKAAFDAYARYVTTAVFLASHLGASILGAALGVLGVVAAAAYLRPGPATYLAVAGTVIGNVVTSAVFGAAAFAQPAVGRAHLRGSPDAAVIDADVYGLPLVATAATGVLLLVVGAIAFGTAVARRGLRAAGTAYAVLLPVFVVAGFTAQVAQPVAATGLAVAAAVIAARLPRDRPQS